MKEEKKEGRTEAIQGRGGRRSDMGERIQEQEDK